MRKLFIVMFLIVLFLSGCRFVKYVPAGATVQPTPEPTTMQDFMSSCVDMDYEGYIRYPNKHLDENVKFSGSVVQSGEGLLRNFYRVAIGDNQDQIVYVEYKLPEDVAQILESDKITVYGVGQGTTTYTAVLGNQVTIPRVIAVNIENQSMKDE